MCLKGKGVDIGEDVECKGVARWEEIKVSMICRR